MADNPAMIVVRPQGGGNLPIPNRQQLEQYNVNREGWEAITTTLYDSAVYAAAGQPFLTFFQNPIGAGVGLGGGAKTLTDTNMDNSGSLPAGVEFLMQSIEVLFLAVTPTVAAQQPAAFGAQAIAQNVNDSFVFYRQGALVLTILQKPYLREAPLMKFPPKAFFNIDAALSDISTTGASMQSRISHAGARGRPYLLKAPLRLTSTQNFNIQLIWQEGVAALPSTSPGRVVVSLDGVMYRRSQ
jgi:hypothetical protein